MEKERQALGESFTEIEYVEKLNGKDRGGFGRSETL